MSKHRVSMSVFVKLFYRGVALVMFFDRLARLTTRVVSRSYDTTYSYDVYSYVKNILFLYSKNSNMMA